MQFELNATNASTLDCEDDPTSTILWARDSAGNEVKLTLNARLQKRILSAAVNAEIENIVATLGNVRENIRTRTDAAERVIREIHNSTINDFVAALKGKQIVLDGLESDVEIVNTPVPEATADPTDLATANTEINVGASY